MSTPSELVTQIFCDFVFDAGLSDDRIEELRGSILRAIREYGESQYSEGFENGVGAAYESQEMSI